MAAVSALYSLLVSMAPVATHTCFSESHWDCLFHPRPGCQPRSCRHLFIFWCVRVCMSSQRQTDRRYTHMGVGDHVGGHKMSPNTGLGRLSPHGDKDDSPTPPHGHTTNLATPKAPGTCESQLPWLWSCALPPPLELITTQ